MILNIIYLSTLTLADFLPLQQHWCLLVEPQWSLPYLEAMVITSLQSFLISSLQVVMVMLVP